MRQEKNNNIPKKNVKKKKNKRAKLNKKWFVVSRAKTYIFRFTTAFGESKMKGALNGHGDGVDGLHRWSGWY